MDEMSRLLFYLSAAYRDFILKVLHHLAELVHLPRLVDVTTDRCFVCGTHRQLIIYARVCSLFL